MNKANTAEKNWHALYVRSRAEKKVLSQLEEKGIEAYLPLITKLKQWSDRRKKVEEPLFKSYVFVRCSKKDFINVLSVYGVLKFVSFEHEAVIVPENQIVAIKKFVKDYEKGEEFKLMNSENLKEGQMVRIITGPMKGVKGRLETIEKKRFLVIRVDVVGQEIPVHIARAKVEPIEEDEK